MSKNCKFGVPCLISILISATNGVVLATEKKQKSVLYDESSIHKIEMITKNVGMTYSGMGPDYRFVQKLTFLQLRSRLFNVQYGLHRQIM